jgi:hypothetical protein
MSRTRQWIARAMLGAVVATTVVTASETAHAQQPTAGQRDEAKRRFQAGLDLFKEGNYQASLVEFKRAYEIAPNYNVLYNIGQVYFQLQDYVNASKYLNQYLDEGGKRITPQRRQEVEGDLDKLKGRIAQVTVTVNVSGAQITVDDQLLGTSPIGQPSLVSAGRRTFTAAKEGRQTVRKVVEVAGGDRLEIQLDLPELAPGQAPTPLPPIAPTGDGTQPEQPPPPPGQPQPDEPEKPFPVAPVVAWSITGVLGIGTAIFGVLALGNDSDLEELKASPDPVAADLESKADSTSTTALVSDIFLVGTVIGAGISIALTIDYATSDPEPADGLTARKAPPKPQLQAKVGPGSLGFAGTF